MSETPLVRTASIDESSEGQRLDNFLSRTLRGVPKSHLYQIIRSGQVRVNGGRARADTRLAIGDQVRLPPVRTAAPAIGREAADSPMKQRAMAASGSRLNIVYESDGLLMVDKPSGVAVHGGSGISSGVIEQLRASRPAARFLELVHRLDRDTSGLLMVATARAVLIAMHDMLRAGRLDKRYVAVVSGQVPSRDRTIRTALRRTEGTNGERVVVADPDGKPAVTTVTGLARLEHPELGPLSLVTVKLGTGRTHQIRVHLADQGWPILGDTRYGRFDINRIAAGLGAGRMFLHARQLGLVHPRSGEHLQVRAAWPEAFGRFFAEPGDRALAQQQGAHRNG